eukprot:gnl/Ergobibamus_cyprinoides/1107.p1 GENE.gnl/Ergobibamus_cyprinoides/1107~~gnl/Ergobibamus_cyprinoides/1107.p1  ORF type:complete len:134 (+),score=61.32 gnl/Ergobibamus_cyprinoides/1107:903-1304(+)
MADQPTVDDLAATSDDGDDVEADFAAMDGSDALGDDDWQGYGADAPADDGESHFAGADEASSEGEFFMMGDADHAGEDDEDEAAEISAPAPKRSNRPARFVSPDEVDALMAEAEAKREKQRAKRDKRAKKQQA